MKPGWVVLFDWDGTLVNSLDIKVRNAGLLFSEAYGVDKQQVEVSYRQHSGIPRRRLFEAICRDLGLHALDGAAYHQLSQRFSEMNMTALTDARTPGLLPEETPAALRELGDRGYPMYISSAADPQEIHHIVKALSLETHFEEVMGSSPGFAKGAQHVEHVCQVHHVSAKSVAFIGDDLSDVQIGRSAGVLTIVKAGTHSAECLRAESADYVIESLLELPALLAQSRDQEDLEQTERL